MHKKIISRVLISCSLIFIALYSLLQLVNMRNFQFFGEIIPRVETDRKVIALTFDDAPAKGTDEVLTILQEHNTKATFFLIGENIEKDPETVQQILNNGHEVGNHSYSHTRMVFKTPEFVRREVEQTDTLIQDLGYQKEIYFRPPYGKKLLFLPWYLARHERKTIMWDVEPEKYDDVAKDTNKIVEFTISNTKPGSIILLHPFFENEETRKALPVVIQKLKEEGYMFVTVSELLEHNK